MTYTPPTEAVEAGARAMDTRNLPRDNAFLALTAAGPIIAAQAKAEALREAAEAVREECSIRSGECFCGSADWLRARAATIEGKSE